jgi:hypothetical protein
MAAMRLTARQGGIVAGMTGFGVSAFVLGWWLDDATGRSAIKANAPAAEWNIPQPKPADLAADAKIVLAKQPFGAAGERAVTSGPTGGAGAGNPLPTQWRISGIVTTETSRYVVVLLRPPGQNTDRTELRQVGDSLPDGGIVRSVDTSGVTIDREGTLVTVRMFEKN